MNLSGNTILITGGTSGIGLEMTRQLMAAGSKVLICGRRIERLQEIKNEYPQVEIKECDVAVATDREALFHWVAEHFPEVNILVNNAGVQLHTNLTQPVDLQQIALETETNFVAPVHLASLFAQHLSSKPAAAIINISSGLAFAPLAFIPVYCATKAAIHSLTLSLRHQLKNTSVKVFEVIPPSVDTELGHHQREDKTQSHGGMPVTEFVTAALKGIVQDEFETAVGQSIGLRAKREELFAVMNR